MRKAAQTSAIPVKNPTGEAPSALNLAMAMEFNFKIVLNQKTV